MQDFPFLKDNYFIFFHSKPVLLINAANFELQKHKKHVKHKACHRKGRFIYH